MFKLFISNLSALLTLRPNFASNPTLKGIIKNILGFGSFILGLFALWLLYNFTIIPMINWGLFEWRDINGDGFYTYKDLAIGIFGPGGSGAIRIIDYVLFDFTSIGNFFEFERTQQNYSNQITFGIIYICIFTPVWFFWYMLSLANIIENRLDAKPNIEELSNKALQDKEVELVERAKVCIEELNSKGYKVTWSDSLNSFVVLDNRPNKELSFKTVNQLCNYSDSALISDTKKYRKGVFAVCLMTLAVIIVLIILWTTLMN